MFTLLDLSDVTALKFITALIRAPYLFGSKIIRQADTDFGTQKGSPERTS